MTATAYSAKVTITSNSGATIYALAVPTGNDVPGDVAPAYGLADPLVIRQALANDARMPLSHPTPDEATVTLIAPDATTYADLQVGDPVGVQVYPQAAYAGTPVEFYGRVATMTAQGHDLGVMYSLSCVDYTADLATLQVGGTVAWPIETALVRLGRLFGELGLATPTLPTIMLGGPTKMAARNIGWTDGLSAMLDTLDSYYLNSYLAEDMVTAIPFAATFDHTAGYRPYVVPNIVGGLLDLTNPFLIRVGSPWTRRVKYAPPARITNLAGVRTITVTAADSSPSTGAPILDGGRVTFSPAFTQDKDSGMAMVTTGTDAQGNAYTWDWRSQIGWAAGGGYLGAGGFHPYGQAIDLQGPGTVQQLDTILDVTDAGAGPSPSAIVQTYRVPFRPDLKTAWFVGTMEWQLWAEPTAWRRPNLTELVTVARVVPSKLPTAREWVVGMVSATTLTVANGRPVLSIDTLPDTNDAENSRNVLGSSLGVASMDSPILAGVTIAQLAPRDTYADYRLVRGS